MTTLHSTSEFARRILRVYLPGFNARFLGLMPKGRRMPHVVVSLTSYGHRLGTVHAAIYSILRGQYVPAEIVLVVNEDLSETVLHSLKPFKPFGLRILRSENLGPHTKYFPVIREGLPEGTCLVTADDDIYYRRDWLRRLVECHHAHPEDVVCWWAKSIGFGDQTIRSYHDWPDVSNTTAQTHHFALGVGGVLYPPTMIASLIAAGDGFLTPCPKNDDIWLHSIAVNNGHKVRQVVPRLQWPRHIPGTQDSGLKHINHLPDGNDRAVHATYTRQAVELIRIAALKECAP
jgi:hypothetical protein